MTTAKRFIHLVILFGLMTCVRAYSQQENIKFEHISIEKGLSQSGVNCILQDRRGFMWFGTGDGLNRYDGYTFEVYKHDPDNPSSLSNNDVLALFEDRLGTLWIGTRRGLNRYNPRDETFTHWHYDSENPSSLSHNHVLSIHESQDGLLWIGTRGGGLNRFDRDSNQFTRWLNQD